ncbi:MAG: type VI secretion system contractile sheath large subunit [Pikeienuella sp.]
MNASAESVGASLSDEVESARFRAFAARIDRLIARIDAALTSQVNAIIHADAFQRMESRWRALAHLVDLAGIGRGVLVRALDVDWRTLSRSMERAADFDQSPLFRLVYDGEFGMPGGLPFGLLVGDYHVSHRNDGEKGDQIEALRRLSSVAAAAFCPLVLNAAPACLGVDRFGAIGAETDIDPRYDPQGPNPDRSRWEELRRAEDSRFLCLVAPGVRIRAPWRRGEAARSADGFIFDEAKDRPLIAGGGVAFAATIIRAFQESGWFAAIRGAYQDSGGGGRVDGFTPMDFGTDRHRLSAHTPIEFRPTATQEEAMIQQGVIPLASLYLDADPVFNANPTLHRPQVYHSAVATQNARLAATLQYVLCTSRFAHYLKVIMREEIGSIADPDLLRARLTEWLREYCIGNDDAPQELKAQYPLRDAGVEVNSIAGRPGVYACTIWLQPHFQLDDISTSFLLVAEAPSTPIAERISA